MIQTAREPIRNDIGFAIDILDVEVEVGNDVLPSRLTTGELRLSLEELQRLVVSTHDELFAGEVVTPRSECMNDGEQLLLMHWIASLSVEHLLGQESYRLQTSTLVLLEHSTDSITRCIGMDNERQLRI